MQPPHRALRHSVALLVLAACAGEAPAPPPAARDEAPSLAAPGDVPQETGTAAPAPAAPDPARVGAICPDPVRPCPGFAPHDLSFVLPTDGLARAEVRSDSFYAVILRSAPACAIAADVGAALQPAFPGRKVFVQRFECDESVENNVTYDGAAPGVAFVAVYAGARRDEAARLLASLPGAERFPGANLRRLQGVFVMP